MFSTQQLKNECAKHIRRYELHARTVHAEDRRHERRGQNPHGVVHRPSHWSADPGFDPFHVRASAAAITRAVRAAVGAGDYQPRPAIAHPVIKPDGTTREVAIFQLADSVVSLNLFTSLLRKNEALFGSYSYAYRSSLTHHDAAQALFSSLQRSPRLFVAEFDFSKFFDNIEHESLLEALESHGFLTTPAELAAVKSFITTGALRESEYRDSAAATRHRGIPQGTAVSLFLANVAARSIDERLGRMGVQFARYADDTVIWSADYGAVVGAADALIQTGRDIGAPVNWSKSAGVRLLTPAEAPAEIHRTSYIDFVGYRVGHASIALKDSTIDRAKARISKILHSNLIQPLLHGDFNPARVLPNFDRDYSVALMQIRRYLYGNLSEHQLRELMRGSVRRLRYPGLMSYYPLVTDIDQLRALDGWLLQTAFVMLKRRKRLLAGRGISELPTPHGLKQAELASARSTNSAGDVVDLTVPSFVRIGALVQRAARTHGANAIARGRGDVQYQYTRDGSGRI